MTLGIHLALNKYKKRKNLFSFCSSENDIGFDDTNNKKSHVSDTITRRKSRKLAKLETGIMTLYKKVPNIKT